MKQQSSYEQSDIRNDDAANYGSSSSGSSSSSKSKSDKSDSTSSSYGASGKSSSGSYGSGSDNYGSSGSYGSSSDYGSSGSYGNSRGGSGTGNYGSGKNKGGGVSEYRSFIADIEDLIKATTSLSGEDLAHAKEALYQRIQTAKDSIEEMGNAISDRARRSVEATNSYVKENPWQAIGIGAAIGLVLGVVVARR